MKRVPLAALVVAGASAILPARAQDAQALATRALAATCGTCHGTDGRALPGAEVPGLAGMPAARIIERVQAFRAGARASTVMQQIAKGYSDEQIERLAQWFAAQPQ